MQIKKIANINVQNTVNLSATNGYQSVTVQLSSYGFSKAPIPLIKGCTWCLANISSISKDSVTVLLTNCFNGTLDAKTGSVNITLIEFN